MDFEQIMAELKKKVYRPVYFLMGEESYFIDAVTEYIVANVLPEQERAFNQIILYGRDTSVYAVLDAAKRYPMMSQYQVLVVKEAQNLKDMDKLVYYIEKPLQSTILVLNYKYKSLDKRSKLYKTLKDSAVLFESKKLYERDVPSWIAKYVSSQGYSIAPAAAALLTEFLGTDLSKIVNELNKLTSLPPGEKTITLDHIEDKVGISKEYNVFELGNALGEKDVLKANRIVNYFEHNPGNGPMVMVVSSIYSYFMKVLTYHYLSDKSQSQVASALKINPFFVNTYVSAARKYPAAKIIRIISILREYDLKSKGVGNSSASQGDLMKEMIFKILH